jgi:hypothetical protein
MKHLCVTSYVLRTKRLSTPNTFCRTTVRLSKNNHRTPSPAFAIKSQYSQPQDWSQELKIFMPLQSHLGESLKFKTNNLRV